MLLVFISSDELSLSGAFHSLFLNTGILMQFTVCGDTSAWPLQHGPVIDSFLKMAPKLSPCIWLLRKLQNYCFNFYLRLNYILL